MKKHMKVTPKEAAALILAYDDTIAGYVDQGQAIYLYLAGWPVARREQVIKQIEKFQVRLRKQLSIFVTSAGIKGFFTRHDLMEVHDAQSNAP
jgi:hypothetical protein